MLCLLTANNNGELSNKVGDIFIPYDINKIVRDTKYFDYDTVAVALDIFKKLGLIYKEENVFKITNFNQMVGSESSSAQRVREYRARQKMLQCNNEVTQEIDIDNKSKDKELEDKDKKIKCHLNFKEKVESCTKCFKKNICTLPTSIAFKEKYNCNVEDYNENEKKPIYYKDEQGNEYWNTKKIETKPLTKEEQEELDNCLNELIM